MVIRDPSHGGRHGDYYVLTAQVCGLLLLRRTLEFHPPDELPRSPTTDSSLASKYTRCRLPGL